MIHSWIATTAASRAVRDDWCLRPSSTDVVEKLKDALPRTVDPGCLERGGLRRGVGLDPGEHVRVGSTVHQSPVRDVEAGAGAVVQRADEPLPRLASSARPMVECTSDVDVAIEQHHFRDFSVLDEIDHYLPFVRECSPVVMLGVLFVIPDHCADDELERRINVAQNLLKPVPPPCAQAGWLANIGPTCLGAAEPARVQAEHFHRSAREQDVHALATVALRLQLTSAGAALGGIGALADKRRPRIILALDMTQADIEDKVMIVPGAHVGTERMSLATSGTCRNLRCRWRASYRLTESR